MDKKQLTKLLTFFTLGDGNLEMHGKHARMRVSHNVQNRDYLDWIKSVMEEVTSVTEYERIKQQEHHSTNIVLSSKTHPVYTTLYDRIYLNGRKSIDPHSLKLLDAQALAILLMDDGSSAKKDGKLTSLYLHTNAFSYGDNLLIKKALEEQLGLMFNVLRNRKWYELRLRNKDYPKLYDMCMPHMFESFYYKLPCPNESPQ